ncbi:MAG: BlaI/MecI/CopY family transcriptional regulator [Thermoguttaceae bacterium]
MADSKDQRDLSAAEWKVMRIVWDLQKGMAREVYTIAGDAYGWAPPTVKTLLKRLVDKGYLTTTAVGNGFLYRPAQSALSILRNAADTLLEHATRTATGPLLAHMVESSPLGVDDLNALQKLIEEKKRSLVRRAGGDKSGQSSVKKE